MIIQARGVFEALLQFAVRFMTGLLRDLMRRTRAHPFCIPPLSYTCLETPIVSHTQNPNHEHK